MPVFESGISAILGDSVKVSEQRGGEYGDSWALDNLVTTFTRSTLESFGLHLSDEQVRLLQMASLIDVKDARLIGPYKEDSVVDGINYRAVFAYLRRLYDAPKDASPAIDANQDPDECVFPGCLAPDEGEESITHAHGYLNSSGCPGKADAKCDFQQPDCHPYTPRRSKCR